MNDTVVIDSSLVTKWIINESDSDVAVALLKTWQRNKMVLLAPDLLIYEISNVIHQNVRRDKLTIDRARKSLVELFALDIVFISSQLLLATQSLELAQKCGLPATYDAYYLALAEREQCELWTADTRLWRAAQGKITWVRNLGEYRKADNDIARTEAER